MRPVTLHNLLHVSKEFIFAHFQDFDDKAAGSSCQRTSALQVSCKNAQSPVICFNWMKCQTSVTLLYFNFLYNKTNLSL